MKKIAFLLAVLMLCTMAASCTPANPDDTPTDSLEQYGPGNYNPGGNDYNDTKDFDFTDPVDPHQTKVFVNDAELRLIEGSDPFGLRVKSVAYKQEDNPYSGVAGTVLDIMLENNTGTVPDDVTVLVLAYTGKLKEPVDCLPANNTYPRAKVCDCIREVKYLVVAGDVGEAHMQIPGAAEFEGVRAIVASYTDADGNVYTNPTADAWLKAAITNDPTSPSSDYN